ncbi:MAG: transposase [Alphaproteobacteria bacterium]
MSNSRIVALHDRTVLIRYREPHSERSRILPLDVMEFIRRFLQHVLSTGFMKIRYYGFINPKSQLQSPARIPTTFVQKALLMGKMHLTKFRRPLDFSV